MGKTSIEWCTHSLNFIKWWCTKISPGCKNCYMMALAKRYPQHAADHAVWRDKAMKELRTLPPGAEVFVGDMYDVFHKDMPDDFIVEQILNVPAIRPDVTLLYLTKRIDRAETFLGKWVPRPNVWLGTSVESRAYLWRIETLKRIEAPGKFISFEPLLEDVGDVDLRGIDGVIVGGESGANKRPFDKAWARNIRDLCDRDGVRFFFKQGSAYAPGQDRLLDGREWNDLAWRVEVPTQQGMF